MELFEKPQPFLGEGRRRCVPMGAERDPILLGGLLTLQALLEHRHLRRGETLDPRSQAQSDPPVTGSDRAKVGTLLRASNHLRHCCDTEQQLADIHSLRGR